jgi:hypothetical protein
VGSEVVVFVSSDGAKASSEEGRTEGKGRPEQLHLSNKEITVHLIKKSANQGGRSPYWPSPGSACARKESHFIISSIFDTLQIALPLLDNWVTNIIQRLNSSSSSVKLELQFLHQLNTLNFQLKKTLELVAQVQGN